MTTDLGRLLQGQKALITGASSGIGDAIARRFAAAGAAVGSRPEAAHKIVDTLHSDGAEAIALQADVSSEPEVDVRRLLRCVRPH